MWLSVNRLGMLTPYWRPIFHAETPLKALGVALGLEALLGLRGDAPVPGLYLPESLIDPTYLVDEMKAIGTRFDFTH